MSGKLEDFLANKPLNERMARIMRGEDDEEQVDIETAIHPKTYADGTPVTDIERGHLKRLLGSTGWQVLLKLLDTTLQDQEDAARRMSLNRATPPEQRNAAWDIVAANRDARNALVALAEVEVGKLAKKASPQSRRDTEKS